MIFCRGDLGSVRILLDQPETFAVSSGLVANSTRFDMYLAGNSDSLKLYIVDSCNIPFSSMPFRYLGVPLSSKRLSAVECERLTVKMTSKIKLWQIRNLSYAARMQHVSTVLINITNFWCQIFMLSKKGLKQFHKICRAYHWDGEADSDASENMNGARVYTPKKLGCLGIWNLEVWNPPVVGKLVWYVSQMGAWCLYSAHLISGTKLW